MSFRNFAAALMIAALSYSTSFGVIIAGWAQNDNILSSTGGFGLEPSDFPQPADVGTGSHSIVDFDSSTSIIDGQYDWVRSFAGTTVNDLTSQGSGGSFAFRNGPGGSNNGAKSVFAVPTTGAAGISVSWAQRGTSTGFDTRTFEYSTDGGANWVDVGAFPGSSGTLTSTWNTVSIDLSGVTALDNNPDAQFRITYSGGATDSDNGNNRWDNFYVEAVPEPTAAFLMIAGVAGLGCVRRR